MSTCAVFWYNHNNGLSFSANCGHPTPLRSTCKPTPLAAYIFPVNRINHAQLNHQPRNKYIKEGELCKANGTSFFSKPSYSSGTSRINLEMPMFQHPSETSGFISHIFRICSLKFCVALWHPDLSLTLFTED